ncbi:MAG: hypothetical protein QME83_05465 [Thermodesulfobacteriota bacterium]|nr:hypothetical protein [Thermodesulfobacteriota bacterium]
MPRSEKIGSGGGLTPPRSVLSGGKGAARGAAQGAGQASAKSPFGGDLYCLKDPFGADFYTRKPPFGGGYYWEVNGQMIYG